VSQRLFLLSAGTLLLWVATALPVWLLGGEWALLHAGTAALLCLVPCLLTLVWVERTGQKQPQQMLLAALGATGVRMFGVLGVGIVLVQAVPPFRGQDGFLIWLLIFYLFTLALEMTLLLTARPSPDGSAGG
jgi:hypothetical protein